VFLKYLQIKRANGQLIRNIEFHLGLNLIIDDTSVVSGKETGNNVGKTTVLKLIDFCLGAKGGGVYTDPENKKHEYEAVKSFLIANGVTISLCLKEDLQVESSREHLIERNFRARKDRLQRIDGIPLTDEKFEEALTSLLFPGHYGKKPTFRQIIAHNIRYSDLSVNNTIKHLDAFTRDDEYETLFLFLLGCANEKGDLKQDLRTQIDLEERFKRRLESEQTKSAYESALAILIGEIEALQKQKDRLNISPSFNADLQELNVVKRQINFSVSESSRLELRRSLIKDALEEMRKRISQIDLPQLKQIYQQATSLTENIQKSFDELCTFHNRMIETKVSYIAQELPSIENALVKARTHMESLLAEELDLTRAITKGESFAVLEKIMVDLNLKHQDKGKYENIIMQIGASEAKLQDLNVRLGEIDNELFSDEYLEKIKAQIYKFNKHFSSVSSRLYGEGEKYALKVEIKRQHSGRRVYEFTSFNTNFSSGKKQGEISCFDIAYTLFADEEGIPAMHFLLTDKKELMHDNQLLSISRLVEEAGLQFVSSILRDKLPVELNQEKFIVLRLSESDKLFRIEESTPKK